MTKKIFGIKKDSFFLYFYFAVLFILIFKNTFIFGEIFFAEDIMRTQVPIRKFVTSEFNNFNFPYWNPNLFCGMPNYASAQSGLFYPFNLILYSFFSVEYAFTFSQILNFALAILFMFMFCKYLGLSDISAVTAGFIFSLSGYGITHYRNAALIASYPYLPAVLLFYIKYLKKQDNKFFILTALFFSIQLLAGHPQLPFYTILTIFFYTIYHLFTIKEFNLKIIVYTFLIFIFSFILAAFQLLPLYQLVRFTANTGIDKFSYITFISMPLYLYAQIIIPFFTGLPSLNSYFGPEHFFELSVFFSITVFFLIFSKFKKVFLNKELIFFWIIGGIAVFMSLGYYNPIYRILIYLPGFNFFRVPVRYNYIFVFAVSVIFSFALEEIKTNNLFLNKYFKTIFGLIAILTFIFSITLFFSKNSILNSFENQFNNQTGIIYNQIKNPSRYDINFFLPKLNRIIDFFKYNFLIISILYFSNIGITYIKNKQLKTKLFVLCISAELLLMSLFVLETTSADFFRTPPESTKYLLKDTSFYRIYSWNRGKMYSKFKTYDGYWYDSSHRYYLRNFLHDNFGNVFGIKNFSGDNTLIYPRYRKIEHQIKSGKYNLLPIFGVKYLLTGIPIKNLEENTKVIDDVIIYEFENNKPLYYFSDNVLFAENETIAFDYLINKVDKILNENLVIAETENIKTYNSVHDSKNEIEIINKNNNYLKFNIKTSKPGIFVLNYAFYPEWRVKVNGKEKNIKRTNYFVQGVLLEKQGEYIVEFYYKGKYFKTGILITFTAIIILLFIYYYGTKKNIEEK